MQSFGFAQAIKSCVEWVWWWRCVCVYIYMPAWYMSAVSARNAHEIVENCELFYFFSAFFVSKSTLAIAFCRWCLSSAFMWNFRARIGDAALTYTYVICYTNAVHNVCLIIPVEADHCHFTYFNKVIGKQRKSCSTHLSCCRPKTIWANNWKYCPNEWFWSSLHWNLRWPPFHKFNRITLSTESPFLAVSFNALFVHGRCEGWECARAWCTRCGTNYTFLERINLFSFLLLLIL